MVVIGGVNAFYYIFIFLKLLFLNNVNLLHQYDLEVSDSDKATISPNQTRQIPFHIQWLRKLTEFYSLSYLMQQFQLLWQHKVDTVERKW
jgi:hypothetical protein